MPFYEYECAKCGHALERLQKMSDTPLKKCPECGKQSLERLISATSFRLKGGGWYGDGYQEPRPAPAKDEKKTDKASEKKESKTGEDKQ